MRILVVGRGGREHALVWRLARDAGVDALLAAPGNPGMAALATCLSVQETDAEGLVEAARDHAVDLVVVGPEAPLAAGLADRLTAAGIAVLGPGRAAAALEASKVWAKEIMREAGVPTAPYAVFRDADAAHRAVDGWPLPVVLKADGLAQGKGVVLAPTREEAHEAVDAYLRRGVFGEAGRTLLLEHPLRGQEISALVLTDGRRYIPLPLAQDHKRLGAGDTGPNTGGMGAVTHLPFLPRDAWETLAQRVFDPILAAMRRRGTPFRGVLYAGCMWTADGPHVLEFNVRLGDPEAQAILPGITGNLARALWGAATGALPDAPSSLGVRPGVGVSVVAAAAGYPAAPRLGDAIEDRGAAEPRTDALPTAVLFHAGTRRDPDGTLRVAGGRVFCSAAWADDLPTARAHAYGRLADVSFSGMYVRPDIGAGARAAGTAGAGADGS